MDAFNEISPDLIFFDKIPEFSNNFDRIVEIVENNEKKKEIARERYREYKKNNYEIHNHKIDNLNKFYQSS